MEYYYINKSPKVGSGIGGEEQRDEGDKVHSNNL